MATDDREAIAGLRIRQLAEQYARAVDSLDVARFEACFTEEVDADYSEVSGTPSVRLPRHLFATGLLQGMSGFDSTRHLVANVTVELDDGAARAVCEADVQATHVLDDRRWVVGGHYTHQVVLTPVGWRIGSLRLARRWQSGDPSIRDLALARGRAGEGPRRVTQ